VFTNQWAATVRIKRLGHVTMLPFTKISSVGCRRIKHDCKALVEWYWRGKPKYSRKTLSLWAGGFTSRVLYLRGRSPWYPWHSKLDGPQRWCGHEGKQEVSAPTGNQKRIVQPRYWFPSPGTQQIGYECLTTAQL